MEQVRPGVVRRDDGALWTTGSLMNALEYVASLAARLMEDRDALERFNLGADIEWGSRQQLRTIQGQVTKTIEACALFMEGLGTDDAQDEIEELWVES